MPKRGSPYADFFKVRKGKQEFPAEFVGKPELWGAVANRLGVNPARGVHQAIPVIGGRRRISRPLTSWKLPGSKGTLTLTTDPLEAKSWNRLKGKTTKFTPRVKDVFEVKTVNGDRYWAIHHENLDYPPSQDWLLFVDTFFRWRAMKRDALQPADVEDMHQFLLWVMTSWEDKKVQNRRRADAILPFGIKQKRDDKIEQAQKKLLLDPKFEDKVKWSKAAISFMKKHKIKHRDLDPSNLGMTTKGKIVITNIAESRSQGKGVGRLGRVKGSTVSAEYYKSKKRMSKKDIDETLKRWVESGDKIYDSSMPIMISLRDLWPHREYTWKRSNSREGAARVGNKTVELSGPLKWDALAVDLKRNGWDPKEPLHLELGKNGKVKVGEGNHRLAIAVEVGLREIPVVMHFRQEVEKTKIPEKSVPKIEPKAVKEAVQKTPSKRKPLSPTEAKQVDDLMGLLGF